MPMSGICIANDETKAEPEKIPILIKSLPGTHAARESSFLREATSDCEIFVQKW